MEEAAIPSLSMGPVGSRFVSQDEVETARAKRDEQWKAAYARLGQEPPVLQTEEAYDGRSLAEKLAANRIAKQEEWEEKTKLANQFRALEEDEIQFLDQVREKQEAKERQQQAEDSEEIKSFKEAVAARASASNPPTVAPVDRPKPSAAKRDGKKLLKGVVVKKKPKAAANIPAQNSSDQADELPTAKRRKISENVASPVSSS